LASRTSGSESVFWKLLGRLPQHPTPEIPRFPDKDIRVEFARQFNIAQTFGHNRSSGKADGSNQIGPVENKVRDP